MAGQLDHRQDKASADHCRCDDDGLRCHFAVLAHSTVLATVPHVPVEYRVGKVNSLWNGVKTMPRLPHRRRLCEPDGGSRLRSVRRTAALMVALALSPSYPTNCWGGKNADRRPRKSLRLQQTSYSRVFSMASWWPNRSSTVLATQYTRSPVQTKMMRADIADSGYDLQDSCNKAGAVGVSPSPGMVHPSAAACCGLSVATSASVVAAVRKFGAFCEGFGFSIRLAI